MTLELNGRVLSLTMDGHISKIVLPAGERGPAGRDGMSIRGDTGPAGPAGKDGAPGRDSMVPGPKGEIGETGPRPPPTPLRLGKILVGDEPHVSINVVNAGTPDVAHVMDLVIPRGEKGYVGARGKDGKDGNHEYTKVLSIGHSPGWDPEFLGCHCIMDGILTLPESFTEEDYGRWTWLKTFDRLVINNAMEGQFAVEKGCSAKMVVVPYAGKYVMTRF